MNLPINQIINGDTLTVLKDLPSNSIDCIITSPPYWGLRDYGVDGQLGLEPTLDMYIDHLLEITAELKRVLKPTGVMFWNHGDCYGGSGGAGGNYNKGGLKEGQPRFPGSRNRITPKCMALQNFRLAIRMSDEQNWILRDTIIWAKKIWTAKENKTIGNGMPQSVKDRCTFAYEPVFMFVKNKKYWSDFDALRVPYTQPLDRWGGDRLKAKGHSMWDNGTGQQTYRDRDMRPNPLGANRPNVWQVNTEPVSFAHFACFPTELVEWCVLAGCPQWICRKCGKARIRVMKVILPSDTGTRNVGGRTDGYTTRLPKKWWADKEFLGWSDCGCNAGWRSGVVLDPFMGSGTTALVALKLGRKFVGIELNPEYCKMAYKRIEPYLQQKNLMEFE